MIDLDLYASLRPRMKSGDLLTVSSGGPIGWLIRWRTHSVFTHVGLIARLIEAGADRVLLLQSTLETGVVLIPLSRYLASLRGSAWWVPMKEEPQTPPIRQRILTFALRQLGKPYDVSGVVKFLLPVMPRTASAWYCSALAAAAYRDAGLTSHDALSPGDLVRQPWLMAPVDLDA